MKYLWLKICLCVEMNHLRNRVSDLLPIKNVFTLKCFIWTSSQTGFHQILHLRGQFQNSTYKWSKQRFGTWQTRKLIAANEPVSTKMWTHCNIIGDIIVLFTAQLDKCNTSMNLWASLLIWFVETGAFIPVSLTFRCHTCGILNSVQEWPSVKRPFTVLATASYQLTS